MSRKLPGPIEFDGPKPTPQPAPAHRTALPVPRPSTAPAPPRLPRAASQTLEPAPTSGDPVDSDNDKPALTPPPARQRWTEAGAMMREAMRWPSDEAAANLSVMRWMFWTGFSVMAFYVVVHGLFGFFPHSPETIYVQRCEDVQTRKDQLKQTPGG